MSSHASVIPKLGLATVIVFLLAGVVWLGIRWVQAWLRSPMRQPQSPLALVGQLQAALKSVQEFDNLEVRPTANRVLAATPTDRDQCLLGVYFRTVANVRTALTFSQGAHFQASAMLARSIIELAMDARLIQITPDAAAKMLAFERSEKLKTAEKVDAFAKKTGRQVADLATYQTYVASNRASILAQRQQVWGSQKPPEHWSNTKIRDRAVNLGLSFEELYEVKYRQLSWHAHAGVTGVMNLSAIDFAVACGDAFGIALECYEEVLKVIIEEYQLEKADPKIRNRLKLARALPFTTSKVEATKLQQELLS